MRRGVCCIFLLKIDGNNFGQKIGFMLTIPFIFLEMPLPSNLPRNKLHCSSNPKMAGHIISL